MGGRTTRDQVTKYLDKHADLDRWPLNAGSLDGLHQAVVIPVHDEQDYLPDTLDSLASCPRSDLDRTLAI